MGKKQVAVSVRDIHKEFILPQSKNTSFKQAAVNIVKKNNKVTQKVLDGISFDVNKGDFFGVVGRNGSGKSTLLKLLAGVYTPTSGEIIVNGGLTPFIELGVGFNPELSGRDNVYLNGALLGYNRKQMSEMYDEIVDFAELGPFMDQKLKNYSSGMQVRLAFSIAIKAKNEILIFDEVLAVGDEAFQRKCLDVFERYKAEGQTVILVTHDMETVRQYCNRAILIHEGKLVEESSPRRVADRYSQLNQHKIDEEVKNRNHKFKPNLDVKLLDTRGDEKVSFNANGEITVHLDWSNVSEQVKSVGVNIFKKTGEHITGVNSLKDKVAIEGRSQMSVSIDLPLQPGGYHVLVEAFRGMGEVVASNSDNLSTFNIIKSDIEWSGAVRLPHSWKV